MAGMSTIQSLVSSEGVWCQDLPGDDGGTSEGHHGQHDCGGNIPGPTDFLSESVRRGLSGPAQHGHLRHLLHFERHPRRGRPKNEIFLKILKYFLKY